MDIKLKKDASYYEVNFDRLAGPTHTTSGLAPGNPLAQANKGTPSYPRKAALQGLEKMKLVHDLGVPQAILPPERRPLLHMLRNLGFHGSDEQILSDSFRVDSELLAACSSASFMWAANMATVSPSADTIDGRVHITPANLSTNFHRSVEANEAFTLLKDIFRNTSHFEVHTPLPAAPEFADEGAANHARIVSDFGRKGIELFVYGKHFRKGLLPRPAINPARQTYEAVQALIRRHRLDSYCVIAAQQNPYVIDLGVFHNDVIFSSHKSFIMLHEAAFVNWGTIEEALRHRIGADGIIVDIVSSEELTVEEAVDTYLFNSQIVTGTDGKMHIISTVEARDHQRARQTLERIVRKHPFIEKLHFVDVSESLRNGGGPACLRLRVELSADQWKDLPQEIKFSADKYAALYEIITRRYPEEITLEDFKDPDFVKKALETTDEIRSILYPSQRAA